MDLAKISYHTNYAFQFLIDDVTRICFIHFLAEKDSLALSIKN
jgi:hypothetical protein